MEEQQGSFCYYFMGSAKRKGVFMEYFEFLNQKWENFIFYVTTRWLSLKNCCDKEPKKMAAFKSMFGSWIWESSARNWEMGG